MEVHIDLQGTQCNIKLKKLNMVSDLFSGRGWQKETPAPDKFFHLLTYAFCQKQKKEETKNSSNPYYPI